MNHFFHSSYDDFSLGAASTHSSTIDHDDGSDFACLNDSVDNVHVRTLSDTSNAAVDASWFE
jgi:hypothetical protein